MGYLFKYVQCWGYRMVALVPALSSLRRGPGTKTNCMATTVKTGSSSEDEIVALTGLLFQLHMRDVIDTVTDS